MCEFGYDGTLMPTIPWLDPAVDRGMWWTLKVHGLRPLCFQGMLLTATCLRNESSTDI